MPQRADWTWMVYMAGDNNLSQAGDDDLEQMRAVGSTSHLNVLTQFDNAGDQGTRRFLVGRNGESERLVDLGETDSGSPETLVDFVRWAKENHPAQRYALILWNHGGGWAPSEIEEIEREAPTRAASKLRRTFFRSSLERILAVPVNQRAICSDDGSGHSLDTAELGKALARIVTILGQPIDLLGMDACLMSNLEVAFEAAPHARVLVASEETEPARGWPYDTLLAALAETPSLAANELGARIVRAYVDSYAGDESASDVTQTALDLTKISDLTTPLDELASALTEEMAEAAVWLWSAQRHSASFGDGSLRDLTQLCRGLEAKGSARIQQAAAAMRAAMASGPGRAVLAECHRGPKVEECGGLSIYLPFGAEISQYYAEVAFAQKTKWPMLLKAYSHG